jgi:hypothetical protein
MEGGEKEEEKEEEIEGGTKEWGVGRRKKESDFRKAQDGEKPPFLLLTLEGMAPPQICHLPVPSRGLDSPSQGGVRRGPR